MNLRDYPSVALRRKGLEKELGCTLSSVGSHCLDESVASTRNCENMIGAVQIPLGVAGPLLLVRPGTKDKGKTYYLPLATTEGALVASVNRGCLALSKSGGVKVMVVKMGASRGPVFHVKNMEENSRLYEFLESHTRQMARIAESTSHHLRFLSYETDSFGRYRFVRFVFDTSEAMGLNMVTIATDAIVRFIEKETGVKCVSLSGNYCVDKKASYLNFIKGRGYEVWAETLIPGEIIQSVLKTTSKAIYDTWLSKCMMGSVVSGSLGCNAHIANVLSAMFLATGQDPAHVVEGSIGITTTELDGVNGNDLYVSVKLPDLMVGTIGGGTGLETQKEALSILNLGKDNSVEELAGVIGGAVLSGEISLLASLSQGTLARAHERLARGGKK